MNFAIGVFLLLYYNQILGVSATAISLAMGLALLLDALSDPLVGAYSDTFKSKLGRRHPFMYAASVPLGLFIWLLFSPPAGASEAFLIGWMVTLLILTRLTFTFFSVPWSALMPELGVSYDERTSLAAYRQLVGHILGGIFGMAVFRFIFPATEAYEQGQLNPDNYPAFALTVGCLMTFWALLSTHLTRKEVPYLLQPTETAPGLKAMAAEILSALTSRNYRLLLGTALIYFGIVSTLAVFDMLINTYFWQLTGEQLSMLALVIISGPILGFIIAPILQPHFQKHQILATALFAQMILSLVSVTARLGGFFPENDSALFLPTIAFVASAQTFVQTLGAISLLSMLADLVDEQQHKTGQRQEGVFSAGVALATKAIGSVGVILGGVLVEHFIGLEPGQAGEKIAEDVIFRLAITDAIIVNAFILIPIFMISRYSLTSDIVASIQTELAAKNSGGFPATTQSS